MTKRTKVFYWIATAWLALGMASTGAVQLFKGKTGAGGVDSIQNLGYPVYFLTILGIWKLLGVIALLLPGFALLKEWTYAGFFFVMSGAIISHLAMGQPIGIFPALLLLILTIISWYCRPADRKLVAVMQ